ncbi:Eukaryotic aspartyl protease family protein [Striga hermonthica]|uniref:Eukaryotic aspartyl protease family protein n=1 Tax=Striga hermonthica TaxID=68872 RepID=A0A9N7RBT3_STRHE|nr:Eukaryotic aspartyl protease family protein [Striga hermonthica]
MLSGLSGASPGLAIRARRPHCFWPNLFARSTKLAQLFSEEASRLDRDLSSSLASYFAVAATTTTSIVETPLQATTQSSGFLARVHVGTNDDQPDMYIIVDTGSSLLWVHCNPDNPNAPEPAFHPKRSPTFRKEMCNEPTSACFPRPVWFTCEDWGCMFKIAYAKGECSGYLGRDTFEFEPLHDEDNNNEVEAERFVLQNITFGCTTHSKAPRVNGVLGLNVNRVSLISHTGSSRFAYKHRQHKRPHVPLQHTGFIRWG